MKILLQNDFAYVGGGQCAGGGNGQGASVDCRVPLYENKKKDFKVEGNFGYTGGYDGKGSKSGGLTAKWSWK